LHTERNTRNAQEILVKKTEQSAQLGDLRTDDKTIIKWVFQEIKCENADWIILVSE
jgi:hypothetical protein